MGTGESPLPEAASSPLLLRNWHRLLSLLLEDSENVRYPLSDPLGLPGEFPHSPLDLGGLTASGVSLVAFELRGLSAFGLLSPFPESLSRILDSMSLGILQESQVGTR
jgi:hypothetical protein